MRILFKSVLTFGIASCFASVSGWAVAPEKPTSSPQSAKSVIATPGSEDANSAEATSAAASDALPDVPQPQSSSSATATPQAAATPTAGPQQTKRILFIIPNFRSVSADVKLPPTTSREKFKIFLEDSFDYSAFVEVALLAGNSDRDRSEPEFHHGAAAYARYYWHSFADNVDGNLMTEYLVPMASREDPRYYTLGHGGVLRRSVYSVSRLIVTRDNQGNATPNLAEVVGNGAAAGVSNLYYPSPERTWTKTGQRWVLQVGIDGVSNLVKEFWPDINAKLFHDKY